MNDVIYIDQTLHGYADGHQLLASSVDLTSEQQSQLLIMSDLSGPAFRSGYESYLTGYPIPNSGFYCIARTWFAPELPRPGCVWTQTFLIRIEDLARISNFDQFNQLFLRPNNSFELDWYHHRVVLDPNSAPPPRPLSEVSPVLRALYGTNKKIVMASEGADKFESLVLAIFEQQWPRLRRNFRFCTGALSLRDTEFDLSISPPEATHSLSDAGLVISERALRSPPPEEEWLEIANRDVVARQQGSKYREFLWRFGPDQPEGRAAFQALTEIYCLLYSQDDEPRGGKILSAMNHFCSSSESAGRLKAEIFGREGKYLSRVGSEADALKLLVTHPYASVIPAASADVAARSAELVRSDMRAATEIAELAGQMGSENAQKFLEGFFEKTNWSGEYLGQIPLTLLTIILGRHPSLIDQPAVWNRPDRMSVVSKIFFQVGSDRDLLRSGLTAMLAANAWDTISALMDNLGSRCISEVFSLIEANSPEDLNYPDAIFAKLADHHEVWTELNETGQLGPTSLKMLSAELDPRSWYARRLGVGAWVRALKAPGHFLSDLRSLRSAVFLLAIGLSSESPAAASLVSSVFGEVYDAGSVDKLNGRLWQELEPHLSSYRPSWDKCARLIRTVARAFGERAWPLQDFFLTFKSPDVLSRALVEIDQTYRGYRYIGHLKEQIASGKISLTVDQTAVFIKN